MTIGIGTNYAQTYDPYWEQYLQASQYLNASRQAQATTLPQSPAQIAALQQTQVPPATMPQAQTTPTTMAQTQAPVDIMQEMHTQTQTNQANTQINPELLANGQYNTNFKGASEEIKQKESSSPLGLLTGISLTIGGLFLSRRAYKLGTGRNLLEKIIDGTKSMFKGKKTAVASQNGDNSA